jgi:hypothetical protein
MKRSLRYRVLVYMRVFLLLYYLTNILLQVLHFFRLFVLIILWRLWHFKNRLLVDLFGKVFLYGPFIDLLELFPIFAVQNYCILIVELGLRHGRFCKLIQDILTMDLRV